MVVCAARDQTHPQTLQLRGQHLRIVQNGLLILFKLGPQRLAQCHGLGRNDVFQWPTLNAREDGSIYRLGVLLLAQDHPPTRAAERLVGGRCDDVGIRDWAGMEPGGDEPGDVRHVRHQIAPHRVSDLAQPRKVYDPRVSRGTGQDHLGLDIQSLRL